MSIINTNKKDYIPKVEVTTDYKQFKRIVGNRPVNISHVNKLIESSLLTDLSYAFPAVVTKDNYLIDGQHRLEKAKTNKENFYFIRLQNGIDDVIVALVNSSQLPWKPIDYVHFYAERGNEQYMFLDEMNKQHHHLSIANILALFGQKGRSKNLRLGKLRIYTTEEEKKILLDLLEAYLSLKSSFSISVFTDRDFVGAIRILFQQISAPEIITALEKAHIEITIQNVVKDYLRIFEQIFNRYRREDNQIRFF